MKITDSHLQDKRGTIPVSGKCAPPRKTLRGSLEAGFEKPYISYSPGGLKGPGYGKHYRGQ